MCYQVHTYTIQNQCHCPDIILCYQDFVLKILLYNSDLIENEFGTADLINSCQQNFVMMCVLTFQYFKVNIFSHKWLFIKNKTTKVLVIYQVL